MSKFLHLSSQITSQLLHGFPPCSLASWNFFLDRIYVLSIQALDWLRLSFRNRLYSECSPLISRLCFCLKISKDVQQTQCRLLFLSSKKMSNKPDVCFCFWVPKQCLTSRMFAFAFKCQKNTNRERLPVFSSR